MLPNPDQQIRQVDTIIEFSDIKPEDYSGSGMLLMAPWEFGLIGIRGLDEARSAYWCCPRCLHCGHLGHAADIRGHGMQFTSESDHEREDRDYIQISDEHLELLKDAGDVQITTNPSIGCRCCGFHCWLDDGGYRTTSDWGKADENDLDPEGTLLNRMEKIRDHRPEAFERLTGSGYPSAGSP